MPPSSLGIDLNAVLPALILTVFAMLVMLVDTFANEARPGPLRWLAWLALAGVLCAGLSGAWLWTQPVADFQGMANSDHFSLTVAFIVLIAAGLGILLSIQVIPVINRTSDGFWTQPSGGVGTNVGGFHQPFHSFATAMAKTTAGSKIRLKPGTSDWTGKISKRIRLDAPLGGAAKIGL